MGRPSGVEGRCPIQTFTFAAGRSAGTSGNTRRAKSRSTSARRQFGAASSPASSTCPASRSPCGVITHAILPSLGITGYRGAMPGSAITAWYPRSVSSGTRSPAAAASTCDLAPAAITARSAAISPASVRTASRRAPSMRKPSALARRSSAPCRQRMTHQRRDIRARIATLTVLFHQHAEGVAPAQRWLALSQFIGRQLQPAHAILAPQPPLHLLGGELGAAREHAQHPLPRDQLADAGLLREAPMQLRRIQQQRP